MSTTPYIPRLTTGIPIAGSYFGYSGIQKFVAFNSLVDSSGNLYSESNRWPVSLPDGPLSVDLPKFGLGGLQLVPDAGVNGFTPLGTMPASAKGCRLYLAENESVTFAIESVVPMTAPTVTFTASNSITGPNWDEQLTGDTMVYVLAKSGNPKYRWI